MPECKGGWWGGRVLGSFELGGHLPVPCLVDPHYLTGDPVYGPPGPRLRPLAGPATIGVSRRARKLMGSLVKKRRKKMSKHKYRKRIKANRHKKKN